MPNVRHTAHEMWLEIGRNFGGEPYQGRCRAGCCADLVAFSALGRVRSRETDALGNIWPSLGKEEEKLTPLRSSTMRRPRGPRCPSRAE